MTENTYAGGCACGAVRYLAKGLPVAELHCQCLHCQKRSGTGHASYIVFAGPDVVSITGRVKTWRVAGDSGNEKSHSFCPTCGTPTHVTFAASPDVTAILPGSLDDPTTFHPSFVTYGCHALEWDLQDPALTIMERGPGS